MRIASLALVALAVTACADGPSPRQKYGDTYHVTGSNLTKKDGGDSLSDVSIYGRDALRDVQNAGSGGAQGADPNAPR